VILLLGLSRCRTGRCNQLSRREGYRLRGYPLLTTVLLTLAVVGPPSSHRMTFPLRAARRAAGLAASAPGSAGCRSATSWATRRGRSPHRAGDLPPDRHGSARCAVLAVLSCC
jgi:hypothetical protein